MDKIKLIENFLENETQYILDKEKEVNLANFEEFLENLQALADELGVRMNELSSIIYDLTEEEEEEEY